MNVAIYTEIKLLQTGKSWTSKNILIQQEYSLLFPEKKGTLELHTHLHVIRPQHMALRATCLIGVCCFIKHV
jgi:hypothetical protein